MKWILRRILGLRPDVDDDVTISNALESALPGNQHRVRRDLIFSFLSSRELTLNSASLAQLRADVSVLLHIVCKARSILLVIENVQWIPQGAEYELLSSILQMVCLDHDLPLMICATFRPDEKGTPPVVRSVQPLIERYARYVRLQHFDITETREFVDQLIDFPKFSDSLHDFVYRWSKGNPFFVIELLRLLTKEDSDYLKRVRGEWYSARGLEDLEATVPGKIEGLILERATSEVPDSFPLLRVMSVAGLDLPTMLIHGLARLEFPDWSIQDLNKHLDGLTRAGFLVRSSMRDGYEFEHYLKREVIYRDTEFTSSERQRVRSEIVDIVLKNSSIFPDQEERTRQLARHIMRGPDDMKLASVALLINAGGLERGQRNFRQSLQYYNEAIRLLPKNTFDRVETLIKRSQIHQMRGQWIQAAQDLDVAVALIGAGTELYSRDRSATRRYKTRIAKERGHVLLRQNALQQADEALTRALEEMEGVFGLGLIPIKRFALFSPKSLGFFQDIVEVYLDFAEIFLRQRDFKKCKAACELAHHYANSARKKIGNESLLAMVYRQVGNIMFEEGNYDQALQWYERVLQYAHEREDRYMQSRTLSEMANVQRAKGKVESAKADYSRAIQIQEKLGDDAGLAISFRGIGDLLASVRDYDTALYYCEQAYKYQTQLVISVVLAVPV